MCAVQKREYTDMSSVHSSAVLFVASRSRDVKLTVVAMPRIHTNSNAHYRIPRIGRKIMSSHSAPNESVFIPNRNAFEMNSSDRCLPNEIFSPEFFCVSENI